MLYSRASAWQMIRALLAAAALTGLCLSAIGCQDDPRWRLLTLTGEPETMVGVDEQGQMIQLFPRNGDKIKVMLAEGLHPITGYEKSARKLTRREP